MRTTVETWLLVLTLMYVWQFTIHGEVIYPLVKAPQEWLRALLAVRFNEETCRVNIVEDGKENVE